MDLSSKISAIQALRQFATKHSGAAVLTDSSMRLPTTVKHTFFVCHNQPSLAETVNLYDAIRKQVLDEFGIAERF